MKTRLREQLLFVAKYIVGLSLFLWILQRVNIQKIFETLSSFSFPALLAVIFISVVNLAIQYRRWRFLIHSHSAHQGIKELLPAFLAGFTFRLIIPGGHAEITKIFMLRGKKSAQVMAFGIEKYFEAYLKVMLILFVLPLVYKKARIELLLLAVFLFVLSLFLPRLLNLSYLNRFREKKVVYSMLLIKTALFFVAILICITFQYYILLNEVAAVNMLISGLTVIFILGAGLIPISVSGLGVREGLAAWILSQYHFPAAAAVGISFFIFLLNVIIPALLGVYFIFRKRRELKNAGRTIKQATRDVISHYRSRERTED